MFHLQLFTDYIGWFTGMYAFSTSLHAPDERMDAWGGATIALPVHGLWRGGNGGTENWFTIMIASWENMQTAWPKSYAVMILCSLYFLVQRILASLSEGRRGKPIHSTESIIMIKKGKKSQTCFSPHRQVFILLDVQHDLQAVPRPAFQRRQQGVAI